MLLLREKARPVWGQKASGKSHRLSSTQARGLGPGREQAVLTSESVKAGRSAALTGELSCEGCVAVCAVS